MAAVDIVRDRERGLPRYNQARRQYGLQPAKTFTDITSNPMVLPSQQVSAFPPGPAADPRTCGDVNTQTHRPPVEDGCRVQRRDDRLQNQLRVGALLPAPRLKLQERFAGCSTSAAWRVS